MKLKNNFILGMAWWMNIHGILKLRFSLVASNMTLDETTILCCAYFLLFSSPFAMIVNIGDIIA